ncbi:hypothetical protein E3N88_16121 [Mikania micrantha]|uniref:Uncharacterized protein n=1 Tax=Mikania micrantha TaxID=192012 RepID=A0A5N6NZ89_9ASTR|nr:hypothetical protein E3N88_16121 [Mikania micrantha]
MFKIIMFLIKYVHKCKYLMQKYRMYLKRLSESRHQGSVDTSFLGILDSSNGLRTLTASGQLGQSLATVLCHSNNSTSLFPRHVIDQRNTSRFRQHLHQPDHYSFNNFNRPALMSMASRIQSQSQSQHVFSIRGGIFPSYNMSNIPNQIEPDSDSKIMTFSDLLSHSSPDRMGPTTSFTDNESGTHLDGTRHN